MLEEDTMLDEEDYGFDDADAVMDYSEEEIEGFDDNIINSFDD